MSDGMMHVLTTLSRRAQISWESNRAILSFLNAHLAYVQEVTLKMRRGLSGEVWPLPLSQRLSWYYLVTLYRNAVHGFLLTQAYEHNGMKVVYAVDG